MFVSQTEFYGPNSVLYVMEIFGMYPHERLKIGGFDNQTPVRLVVLSIQKYPIIFKIFLVYCASYKLRITEKFWEIWYFRSDLLNFCVCVPNRVIRFCVCLFGQTEFFDGLCLCPEQSFVSVCCCTCLLYTSDAADE